MTPEQLLHHILQHKTAEQALLELLQKEHEVFKINNPEWISVKERLPENGIDVLVHDAFGDPTISISTAAYSNVDGKWIDYLGNDHNYQSDITHWMPLPTPPKNNPEKILTCRLSWGVKKNLTWWLTWGVITQYHTPSAKSRNQTLKPHPRSIFAGSHISQP